MEHRINNIKTIKGKFNIVDVIVIALALLLIFTALFIFDPFDWVAPIDRREVAVTYVIEISGVDNELCTGIEAGQTVINSVTGETIGRVNIVLLSDAYQWELSEKDGKMVKKTIAGKNNVSLTIVTICTFERGIGYIVGGQQIAVGTPISIRLPSFLGGGFCVGISEMD